MKGLKIGLLAFCLMVGSVGAVSLNSYRHRATAGIFLDDYDNMISYPYLLTEMEGFRIYSNLSNLQGDQATTDGNLGTDRFLSNQNNSQVLFLGGMGNPFKKFLPNLNLGLITARKTSLREAVTSGKRVDDQISYRGEDKVGRRRAEIEITEDAESSLRQAFLGFFAGYKINDRLKLGLRFCSESVEDKNNPAENSRANVGSEKEEIWNAQDQLTRKTVIQNNKKVIGKVTVNEITLSGCYKFSETLTPALFLSLTLGSVRNEMTDESNLIQKTNLNNPDALISVVRKSAVGRSRAPAEKDNSSTSIVGLGLGTKVVQKVNEQVAINYYGNFGFSTGKTDGKIERIYEFSTEPAGGTPEKVDNNTTISTEGKGSEISLRVGAKVIVKPNEIISFGFGAFLLSKNGKEETTDDIITHNYSEDTPQQGAKITNTTTDHDISTQTEKTSLSTLFLPIGIEIKTWKNLVLRFGAKYTSTSGRGERIEKRIKDERRKTTTKVGNQPPTTVYNQNTTNEGRETNSITPISSRSQVYYYGLGWQITDNLQIDLLSFVDRLRTDDLEDWLKNLNLSVVLKF